MDLHHLPGGTHSLAPRPGSLVRLTFHSVVLLLVLVIEGEDEDENEDEEDSPKWCPWQDSHLHDRRFELRASALGYTGDAIGAHGRTCTGTSRVLGAPSLRWTTWANWPAEPKLGERRLVPREGFAPSTSPF